MTRFYHSLRNQPSSLCPGAHKASTSDLHLTLSLAIRSKELHDQPWCFISASPSLPRSTDTSLSLGSPAKSYSCNGISMETEDMSNPSPSMTCNLGCDCPGWCMSVEILIIHTNTESIWWIMFLSTFFSAECLRHPLNFQLWDKYFWKPYDSSYSVVHDLFNFIRGILHNVDFHIFLYRSSNLWVAIFESPFC